MKRTLRMRLSFPAICALTIAACECLVTAGCGPKSTPPPVSVSLTPLRGGAVTGQSIAFAATVQNDVGAAGVSWNSSSGSFSSQSKTTASLTAPNATGNVTITATSIADNTKSASATIAITDLAGVTTYHNDLARTGANTHEFALTPASVTTSTFVKLFSCTVDGAIYAQPLWAPQVAINGAKHNVVVVATQHDSVYAFDADANPCVTLWHFTILDAAHGGGTGAAAETSVPSSAPNGVVGNGFGDITPEVGITGTPVIDPASNTIYVVSKSFVPNSSPLAFFQRLHALDLITGGEKFGGPVTISASVSGTGDGSNGGILSFDPGNEHQRPGLALAGGVVYISWASHEDHDPYHGWVIGYSASTLAQTGVFNTNPNQVAGFAYSRGGIWMSGSAPAADAGGNIYFSTGNGAFNGTDAYSDSVVKLGPASGGVFPVADYFTPFNQSTLDSFDGDVGAGGVVLLPNLSSGQQILVQVGKDGTIHVLDRSNLGQYCNGCASDTQIVQEIQGQVNGMWGTPAYWNGNLYIGGAQDGGTSGDNLKAFSFNPALAQPLSAAPTSLSSHVYNFSGPTPSVSSNPTMTNGIVWALDNSQYGPPTPNGSGPAVLHAYDATNLATELWNSSQGAGNTAGNAVKFTVPTIANGKVYIGTRGNSTTGGGVGELDVYGLKPN